MSRILILGASENPERYSNKAAHMLKKNGYSIVMIGHKQGELLGEKIVTTTDNIDDIDTVTMYLGPKNQKEYYNFLLNLKPRRVIFNPGSENPELESLLQKENIETIEACTLVLLSTKQF